MEELLRAGGDADHHHHATALIGEFETLAQVLAASRERLSAFVPADVSEHLIVVGKAMRHAGQMKLAARPLLKNYEGLYRYLVAEMAHGTVESFRVLHLTARHMLIRDETMWTGTTGECAVHVREIVRRALEIGSAAIIIAHNHPGGDPAPSTEDIRLTQVLATAAHTVGVVLHDHIIVSRSGCRSLREEAGI